MYGGDPVKVAKAGIEFAKAKQYNMVIVDTAGRLGVDADLMKHSLNIEVNRALDMLSEKEAEVIRHYYGINDKHPMSLQEIGDSFGLTRERVRQIKEKAIRRLKHTSRSKILKTYLG
jgi:RNA polymerase sigma factor (sigma-70 family)